MQISFKSGKCYIGIPVERGAGEVSIRLADSKISIHIDIELASDKIDSWAFYDCSGFVEKEFFVECPDEKRMYNAISTLDEIPLDTSDYFEATRPRFHYTAHRGKLQHPAAFINKDNIWTLKYIVNPYGVSCSNLKSEAISSRDLLHWSEACVSLFPELPSAKAKLYFDTKNNIWIATEDTDTGVSFSVLNKDGSSWTAAGTISGKYPDAYLFFCGEWFLIFGDGEYLAGSFCKSSGFTPEGQPKKFFFGETQSFVAASDKNETILLGISKKFSDGEAVFSQQLSVPLAVSAVKNEFGETELRVSAHGKMDHLHIWKRVWKCETVGAGFEQDLRFRIAADVWPGIKILPKEGKTSDIRGELFEITAELCPGREHFINFDICGVEFTWQAKFQTMKFGEEVFPFPLNGNKRLYLHIIIDRDSMELISDDGASYFLYQRQHSVSLAGVTGNFAANSSFKLQAQTDNKIKITSPRESVKIYDLSVYCLRPVRYSPQEAAIISKLSAPRELYRSKSYTISDNQVFDKNVGDPPAYTPDRNTIFSPTRITEEFTWRDSPYGDMVRVINRTNVWHPSKEIDDRFPDLHTGIPSYDAAYRVALDVFYKNSHEDFTINGQTDSWGAGQFQGEGEGFGIWTRDATHIAIRSGNLIDRERGKNTLRYTLGKGFDNGEDGPPMPIVGIWDYYLATGDLSMIFESWPGLLGNIKKCDERFDEKVGLIKVGHSTSNDAFPEPECGGFSLGSELYYMDAYRAMAEMGEIYGEAPEQINAWRNRAEIILKNIRTLFWKEQEGYFASGPVGSESYEKANWETAGAEGAIWPRFGIADDAQRRRVLDALPKVALNEFGINLFPYRKLKNHFTRACWGVWYAGFAAAAAADERPELIFHLISAQVRHVVLNKTFQEVVDADNGLTWRWPGQLWHAAGFVSMYLYGVFGISYDKNGLHFKPAIPEQFVNCTLDNLRYRDAIINIKVNGSGCHKKLLLDGKPVEFIPADISGIHELIIC